MSKIKEIQEKLYESIEEKGLSHEDTVSISEELDTLMIRKQIKKRAIYENSIEKEKMLGLDEGWVPLSTLHKNDAERRRMNRIANKHNGTIAVNYNRSWFVEKEKFLQIFNKNNKKHLTVGGQNGII